MIYLLLIAIHLIVCLLVFLAIRHKALSVHRYMTLVAFFVPFWGLVLVFILHFQIAFDADDAAEIGVEKLRLESELYKSVTVDDKRSDATVPLEEALLINSAGERRSLIMDILADKPGDYVEFLQKAGNNDDTEVVHYAVTAMVEISKENDYMLQKLEAEYTSSPEDFRVITNYSNFLWDCLSRNLMQGQVETMNRELFSTLMKKKLSMSADVKDYERFVQNELKRDALDSAEEALRVMKENWPHSEEYILLNIRFLSSKNKGDEIRAFISEVENAHVYLSSKTKEALAFWAN